MAAIENILISGSSGLGKSRFAKDLARRINIINGKSINSIYTVYNGKDGKIWIY